MLQDLAHYRVLIGVEESLLLPVGESDQVEVLDEEHLIVLCLALLQVEEALEGVRAVLYKTLFLLEGLHLRGLCQIRIVNLHLGLEWEVGILQILIRTKHFDHQRVKLLLVVLHRRNFLGNFPVSAVVFENQGQTLTHKIFVKRVVSDSSIVDVCNSDFVAVFRKRACELELEVERVDDHAWEVLCVLRVDHIFNELRQPVANVVPSSFTNLTDSIKGWVVIDVPSQ